MRRSHPLAVEGQVVQLGGAGGGLLVLEGHEAKATRGTVGEVSNHCIRDGAELLLEKGPQIVCNAHAQCQHAGAYVNYTQD